MKKAAILVLVVFVLSLIVIGFLFADSKDDYQEIKKAVKKNPNYKAGEDVKWFKVLVTDNETKKAKVKITLPIKLFEVFVECAKDEHLRINRDECDIDLRELFNELKKAGPLNIIEIYENGATMKIWLE